MAACSDVWPVDQLLYESSAISFRSTRQMAPMTSGTTWSHDIIQNKKKNMKAPLPVLEKENFMKATFYPHFQVIFLPAIVGSQADIRPATDIRTGLQG